MAIYFVGTAFPNKNCCLSVAFLARIIWENQRSLKVMTAMLERPDHSTYNSKSIFVAADSAHINSLTENRHEKRVYQREVFCSSLKL